MDDQEVREFRAQVQLLQRRLRRESLPVAGVSRTALQVLRATGRLPDGAQPRHVATELSMTSSNVAAALRELEAARYIRREKDPADARRVRLSVTDAGTAVLADIRGERDTWFGRAVEATLTPAEQRKLVDAGLLLQRIAEFDEIEVAR
jgi:DNA-binding MarR family transcriptional regulator